MPDKFKTHKLYISVLCSSQNKVTAVDTIAAKEAVIVVIKNNNLQHAYTNSYNKTN